MWAGVSIKKFEESIYRNFYSSRDIEIIRGLDDVALPDLKRLINKAKKVGDLLMVCALEEMYDELLYTPPQNHLPLPPRCELKARYDALIYAAEQRLSRKNSPQEQ